MNLTQVILGEVVTEKAMRQKERRTYILRIHPKATKVDVKSALRKYFNVEPTSVRIIRVPAKQRLVGRGDTIQKRDATKRAIITLGSKSKVLDLTTFQT